MNGQRISFATVLACKNLDSPAANLMGWPKNTRELVAMLLSGACHSAAMGIIIEANIAASGLLREEFDQGYDIIGINWDSYGEDIMQECVETATDCMSAISQSGKRNQPLGLTCPNKD